MNLEKQVCSLELAQKLKDLGVNQESLFYYLNIDGEGVHYIYFNEHMPEDFEYKGDPISAFTVAELGNMLPNAVRVDGSEPFDNYRVYITKFYSVTFDMKKINNFIVNYECDTSKCGDLANRKLTKNFYDPNEANARAMMLIYLIENKLISI